MAMKMPAASLTKTSSGNGKPTQGTARGSAVMTGGASNGGGSSDLAKAAAGLSHTKGGGMPVK